MDDPANDFDSVQWRREEEQLNHPKSPAQSPPSRLKSNGKRRQSSANNTAFPERVADQVDAGLAGAGYLHCTVDQPQKESEGTKDAYISYLVTTYSDFKTFANRDFTVRRRFTDFVYLYKTLFRQYAHIAVPPLPDKHKMEYVRGDRFGPDFTQRRAHALDRFIKRITLHPVLRRNSLFLNFLETSDWNSTMRSKGLRSPSLSEPGSGGSIGANNSASSSTSAFESFQDWSINLFTKPHKPDKRFIEVREKADKLDEDLGHVEKIVSRVARREGDLEQDYYDLATQFRKLVNMEPGVGNELTSFATSVETTSQGMKGLKEATDQDYLGSLRDMSSYVATLKALLKLREQKQIDFEALSDYLTKAANDRDILASQHGSSSISSGAASFIRSKMEDVRGVDHEQSRRDRLRKTEMQIERLTREVDDSKKLSEAFDEQVIAEVGEFERIKACEFKETLGGLANAEIDFWKGTIDTWQDFIKGMEQEEEQRDQQPDR
ncbi:MAG: intercellular trafficking and secretion [Alyxoria varia]|nr:MAG: intercellular trafficking and secretion [Alyxoria varia]